MSSTTMASAISTPIYLFSSSSSSSASVSRKPVLYTLTNSSISYPQTPNFRFSTWTPQLGLGPFSPWCGLKHLGISISQQSVKIGMRRKCKGKAVYASLFGVGAPEALVIGVVALLVFGPKGLAEVARNLGKTLREFQPTIKELQEVSREFKSTLEREIGLDEIESSMKNTYSSKTISTTSTPPAVTSSKDAEMVVDPNGTPSPNKAYSSEDYLKITEEQLKASAAQQQNQTPPLGESQSESQSQPQGTVQEAAAVKSPQPKPENNT
ncbi:sec-independent protein translocase protein TATB, chloroplastic [Cornus florida]|uniref:sec-independent protein translocase protein TATB, chloroplastic n=1 Tax=Cornus florida TaxID=4283 RepID=UPI0028997760|nr:sec-independent protein translocase protein TATB, chloroplastic [Cornus florida]